MTDTITLGNDYIVVNCGKTDCNQSFAMTQTFYRQTKRTKETWFCPSGHPRVWLGKSDEAKLEESLARETALRDQLGAATRDAEHLRQQILRDRRRFANGVCPCCSRSFENVRRHMSAQHPDYDLSRVRDSLEFRCSCGRRFESLRGLATHQGKQRGDGWDSPAASRWTSHLTVVSGR